MSVLIDKATVFLKAVPVEGGGFYLQSDYYQSDDSYFWYCPDRKCGDLEIEFDNEDFESIKDEEVVG